MRITRPDLDRHTVSHDGRAIAAHHSVDQHLFNIRMKKYPEWGWHKCATLPRNPHRRGKSIQI